MTFDQQAFNFQGDCEYTLVRNCSSAIPDFHLISDNYRLNPSATVSYLKTLRLHYAGSVFTLDHGNMVYIDNIRVTLPYYGPDGVTIFLSHPNVVSIFFIHYWQLSL